MDCINYCDTVLNPDLSYLSHNRFIEAKAVCDHHVDLPLAVLLSDALVGGEPRQGGLQSGQAVARGLADIKQLTSPLGHREGMLLSTEYGISDEINLEQKWSLLVTMRLLSSVLCEL